MPFEPMPQKNDKLTEIQSFLNLYPSLSDYLCQFAAIAKTVLADGTVSSKQLSVNIVELCGNWSEFW
jgi:hypothetical protein